MYRLATTDVKIFIKKNFYKGDNTYKMFKNKTDWSSWYSGKIFS
jgi:hypothetical protein